ncbi:DUF2891 family protein [Streptomyces boncukensis]|uniref:DUF2891 family protein n=1 Tax=Streptomyces boncukensis TaxID=2711219 RepID=A0A6G4X0N9_9ACTN|nr:DUF2891 family protein [Streptomyces boncukensis]NGO71055.1 DUF2891 family protein [Streptomyces boncukensis]
MNPELAARAAAFAALARANVTREYPNAPAHLFAGPDDLVPPRAHHPAFYGAYDWHSSVHMHWLLVRLLRRSGGAASAGGAGGAAGTAPLDAAEAAATVEVLEGHLSEAALRTEADYLRRHPSFERPYGWAWLLALAAESAALAAESRSAAGTVPTGESTASAAERWCAALAPAVGTVAELVTGWLEKATYPVRHGTHANSAFALGLILDSAEGAGAPRLLRPVAAKVRDWYLPDHGAATRWEPSGQDFLSPLLTEADAVRRVLLAEDFASWLSRFLPELDASGAAFLPPPRVSDPADPQIGHLLGLCLSRAAALSRIAAALPEGDARVVALSAAAEANLAAGLPAGASGDFTSDHWLATFATLALEARTH